MIKTDIKTILNKRFGQPKKMKNTADMIFFKAANTKSFKHGKEDTPYRGKH